jgi:hypothetical protein
MAFALHHKKYKTEENTKTLTSKKNDSETKPKQNKTEFKKRKKSFCRRYKIASSTTYNKRKWRSHMIAIPGARLFTHLISGRGSTKDEGVREV